jgi:hypothetical protein
MRHAIDQPRRMGGDGSRENQADDGRCGNDGHAFA